MRPQFASTRNVAGLYFTFLLLLSLQTAVTRAVDSVRVARPPDLDGVVQRGEWDAAADSGTRLPHGLAFFQYDDANLYILLDLTGDTHDDPPVTGAPWGDFLSLSVDVDRNRAITPNVDLSYGLYPGRYALGVQTYIRPGAWTGLRSTQARLGAGFGISTNARTPHRVWEIAIPLREIDAGPGRTVRLGIRMHSQTPAFDDAFPTNLNRDFSGLLEVSLSLPRIASEVTPAQVKRRFHISSTFGDRDRYQLKLTRPGRLRLNVTWSGTAQTLALILNGPGQTGYYARQDGRSPLAIDFELTSELLERGDEWLVSIVNFSRQGSADGVLFMEYPAETRRVLRPALPGSPTSPGATPAPAAGTTVQRTIAEDGSVELRYPDGTIKSYSSGGQTIIFPDGREMRMLYLHVQPDTPPSLPSDPQMLGWLQWSNDSLLDFMRRLVGNDETAVGHYLEREQNTAQTLYEQILLRTEVVNQLLLAE